MARHSVLYVTFDPRPKACPIANAEEASPEVAYEYLKQGGSWCTIIDGALENQACLAWLIRTRQNPKTSQVSLIVLLWDPGGPEAIAALQAGADVVLSKEVHRTLLEAQVRRLRQRYGEVAGSKLSLGAGWTVHSGTRLLQHAIEPQVALPPQAFRLAWALAVEEGRLVTIPMLRLLLDIPARASDDTVHTAIAKLRRLLRPTGLASRLITVRGAGYRWTGIGEHDAPPESKARHGNGSADRRDT